MMCNLCRGVSGSCLAYKCTFPSKLFQLYVASFPATWKDLKVLCRQEQLDVSLGERKKNSQDLWIPVDFSFSLQILHQALEKMGLGMRLHFVYIVVYKFTVLMYVLSSIQLGGGILPEAWHGMTRERV